VASFVAEIGGETKSEEIWRNMDMPILYKKPRKNVPMKFGEVHNVNAAALNSTLKWPV
jgi:hypothetical protein